MNRRSFLLAPLALLPVAPKGLNPVGVWSGPYADRIIPGAFTATLGMDLAARTYAIGMAVAFAERRLDVVHLPHPVVVGAKIAERRRPWTFRNLSASWRTWKPCCARRASTLPRL